MIKLTPDFREFLSLLNSTGTEYLLIGGYAVGLYGFLRPTKDIDIWVATSPVNIARLRDTLLRFGFSNSVVGDQPLFDETKTMLRMGVPPNRLEVLTQISGVSFEDCYRRRQMMEIDGLSVSVIDLADLIRNKQSTGRAGDLRDAERLSQRG